MNIQNYTFITAANMGDVCPVFRRRFLVHKQIQQAALEITALGVYVAELNGTRVGDFVLAPGWTSYEHRLQVQTYDITELLTEENELRVTVGKGWFRSPIPGWEDSEDKRRRVSQPCGLIAALTLCYTDGSSETIGTDASWDVGESPVRFSEIYDGERCDATFETQEWEQASLLDWSKEIKNDKALRLIAGGLRLSTKPTGFVDRGDSACCAHSLAGDARTLAGCKVCFPRRMSPENTDYD